MHRKLAVPLTVDPAEQSRLGARAVCVALLNDVCIAADAALVDLPSPSLIPQLVRVRYARPETEWQQKRRKQSYYYHQYLFEQDPWINCDVRDEASRTARFCALQTAQMF